MTPKKINLALQGGGAHGAFTWGVLDHLLEDERIEIEGLSGTSAGAMNAGALLQGYLHGGRSGARSALEQFWHRTAEMAAHNPIRRSAFDQSQGIGISTTHPHTFGLIASHGCSHPTNSIPQI